MTDQNTPTNTLEKLRDKIFYESEVTYEPMSINAAKPEQVVKINLNKLMRLISQAVNKARLKELNHLTDTYGGRDDTLYIDMNIDDISDRIKELETPNQVEES